MAVAIRRNRDGEVVVRVHETGGGLDVGGNLEGIDDAGVQSQTARPGPAVSLHIRVDKRRFRGGVGVEGIEHGTWRRGGPSDGGRCRFTYLRLRHGHRQRPTVDHDAELPRPLTPARTGEDACDDALGGSGRLFEDGDHQRLAVQTDGQEHPWMQTRDLSESCKGFGLKFKSDGLPFRRGEHLRVWFEVLTRGEHLRLCQHLFSRYRPPRRIVGRGEGVIVPGVSHRPVLLSKRIPLRYHPKLQPPRRRQQRLEIGLQCGLRLSVRNIHHHAPA